MSVALKDAPSSPTPLVSVGLSAFALCPYAELAKTTADGSHASTKSTVSLGAAGVVRAIELPAGQHDQTLSRLQIGDEVWTRIALSDFGSAPSQIPANNVFKIPLGISLAQAATLGDSAIMAMVALRDADVGADTRLLVHGAANPFGHAAAALSRYLGALTFATIDHATERTIAESSRAIQVVAARGRLAAEELLAATNGHTKEDHIKGDRIGFDVIFDAAVAEHMALNIAVLAQDGMIVTCPLRGRVGAIHGVEMLAMKNGQIRFASQSAIAQHDMFELGSLINTAINAGAYRPLVGQVISPSQLDDALDRVGRGRAIGNVVLQTNFPAAAAPALSASF